MNHITLPHTDLRISRIAFGCMSLKADEANSLPLIHQALDQGINLFDTADLYEQGANETLLGKALAGRRQQALIATKVGNQWRADGSGWDWNPTKAHLLAAAEQSLRRLHTDCIDLYQLHGGTLGDPTDETIEAFELLKQQGKIRHYGISSIRPNVIRTWAARSRITTVMMQYSLLDRRPEETALPLLQQEGIGVLARGALAQGLLAGKPPKPYLTHSQPSVQTAANAIHHLTANTNQATTDTDTAVGFVLHHPAIAAAVIGIRTQDQLQQAIHAGSQPILLDPDWQSLSNAAPATFYAEHR